MLLYYTFKYSNKTQENMKRGIMMCCLVLIFTISSKSQEQSTMFKVMSWNILHGGHAIENGVQNVIQIIKEINPDIIVMVETYGSGQVIADSLGYNFHLVAPEGTALHDKNINLSILSRYPLGDRIDTAYPFYLGGRDILIENQRIHVLATWFHYDPWEDEPENLGKNVQELLAWEKIGAKYEMLQKVLPYIKKNVAQSDTIPTILGGDLNTPSHLDWGDETKEMHHGLMVPWYSTKVLETLGLKDTYRTLNPSPVKYPGITWNTKDKRDAHRIDYIFYKGYKIKAITSETFRAFLNEPFSINGKTFLYPSDHGFVVTLFKLNQS